MTHWDHQYEELKAFKEKNGHCRVTPKANKSLATWLSSQRRLRRKYQKTDKTLARLSKLEALGVDWDPKTSRANEEWKKRYEELKRFKEDYGHCDVVFVRPHYTPLGHWVTEQLRCYFNENYKRKTWTEKKFQLLDSIGFDWNMVARRYEAQKNKKSQDEPIDIPASDLKRPSSLMEGNAKKSRKIMKKERKNIIQTPDSTTRTKACPTREETESKHIDASVDQSHLITQNRIIKEESGEDNANASERITLSDRIQILAEKIGVELDSSSQSLKDKLSCIEMFIQNKESSGSIAFRIYNLEQELVMP